MRRSEEAGGNLVGIDQPVGALQAGEPVPAICAGGRNDAGIDETDAAEFDASGEERQDAQPEPQRPGLHHLLAGASLANGNVAHLDGDQPRGVEGNARRAEGRVHVLAEGRLDGGFGLAVDAVGVEAVGGEHVAANAEQQHKRGGDGSGACQPAEPAPAQRTAHGVPVFVLTGGGRQVLETRDLMPPEANLLVSRGYLIQPVCFRCAPWTNPAR